MNRNPFTGEKRDPLNYGWFNGQIEQSDIDRLGMEWRSPVAKRLDKETRKALKWYYKDVINRSDIPRQGTAVMDAAVRITARGHDIMGMIRHHIRTRFPLRENCIVLSIRIISATVECIEFVTTVNVPVFGMSIARQMKAHRRWQIERGQPYRDRLHDEREYKCIEAAIDEVFRKDKMSYMKGEALSEWCLIPENHYKAWSPTLEDVFHTQEYIEKANHHIGLWLKDVKAWPLQRWRERERKRKRQVERQAKKASAFFQAMAMASAVKGEAINE